MHLKQSISPICACVCASMHMGAGLSENVTSPNGPPEPMLTSSKFSHPYVQVYTFVCAVFSECLCLLTINPVSLVGRVASRQYAYSQRQQSASRHGSVLDNHFYTFDFAYAWHGCTTTGVLQHLCGWLCVRAGSIKLPWVRCAFGVEVSCFLYVRWVSCAVPFPRYT